MHLRISYSFLLFAASEKEWKTSASAGLTLLKPRPVPGRQQPHTLDYDANTCSYGSPFASLFTLGPKSGGSNRENYLAKQVFASLVWVWKQDNAWHNYKNTNFFLFMYLYIYFWSQSERTRVRVQFFSCSAGEDLGPTRPLGSPTVRTRSSNSPCVNQQDRGKDLRWCESQLKFR